MTNHDKENDETSFQDMDEYEQFKLTYRLGIALLKEIGKDPDEYTINVIRNSDGDLDLEITSINNPDEPLTEFSVLM